MPHESTVHAFACPGSDGWAIMAQPPGIRDLADDRYWETSLSRSLSRRGTRPLRFRGGREVRVAAALAVATLGVPAAAGASTLDLSRGSSGAAVQQLQTELGIDADGQFGPQTERAVRRFQRAHGLPVTGLVGPLTRAALGSSGTATPSTSSTSSDAIRTMQQKLGVDADGVVGPQTRAAIKAFQSSHGLPTTGEPDQQTLSAVGSSAPATTPTQTTSSSKAQTAVAAAMAKVGSPYSYGATGPSSFDCSGLVMYAFRQAGVSVPHSSFAQFGLGRSVSGDQIQAGDLVFFNTAGAGASDVGIATSPTTAVSATTHGVMTHPIRSGYWGSHFVGARRVL